MKKITKYSLSTLLIILSISIIYGILFYFNFFKGWTTVSEDNKVSSYVSPVSKEFDPVYTSKLTFSDQPVTSIDNVKYKFFNTSITTSSPTLLKSQRYYIPLNDVTMTLGYYSTVQDNNILITNGTNDITIKSNNIDCDINGTPYKLRGHILIKDHISYISICDIEKLFNLTSTFDFEKNEVTFLNKANTTIKDNLPNSGKAALIRLEDFSAGDSFFKSSNQAKGKALGDYLYSEGIKFHIAWVAHFKAPSDNIDNNLLTNNCIENVGFINLLDYLINCGGLVGSHGYTHQFGEERSLNGTELSRKVNTTEAETRKVLELAIDASSALNIPVGFFESPHYKASSNQKAIIEEYFQYIYEANNPLIYHSLYKTSNNNLYIPTPLSYVKDLNVDPIINNLEDPRYGLLASLFYHPTKELDFIELLESDNTFTVKYSEESPLKQIVSSLNKNNYKTIYVNEF